VNRFAFALLIAVTRVTFALLILSPLACLFAEAKTITVGAAGADFTSVQQAVDAAPQNSAETVVIEIQPGTYKGRVEVPKSKPKLTFRGAGADASKTIITNDWNASFVRPGTTQPVGTSGSAATIVAADDLSAENLTFENSAGETGQAVALRFTGDRGKFVNCRFLGWQDTLYVDGGRAYFKDCYVEGRVDFIFGGSAAVFEKCTIHSKNGGYVTAARTPPEQKFGYVFLDCTLTGDPVPTYLGRPWQWDRGRRAHVAFIRCKMGPHVRPEGWNQWDRPNNPNTRPAENTRYFEFVSTDLEGKPLDVSKRVPWSHQLTEEQAAAYTLKNVLADWSP
jgi:pectinesterase